jgi:SsrA-binding protein
MPSLIKNRRAYYDYEIIETIEAGIKLLGYEVKSLKEGQGNLTGTHIKIDTNSVSLIGLTIPPYSKAGTILNYDPSRTRKLLMHKSEIKSLESKVNQQGYTLIPLVLYTKGGLIKLSLGLARGKKKEDKRKDIIEKQQKREIERTIKNAKTR